MALREHLGASGVECSAVNITRHRQVDHDRLFFPRSAAQLIARVLQLRADVLHVHVGGDLSRKDLLLCLALSAIPGARTVLTCHSGGFPSSPAGRAAAPNSFAGFVLRRLDRVIGVNADIAATFRRFGCAAERVVVIEPHAEPAVAEFSRTEWPPRFRAFAEAHDPVLLTVGGLEPEYSVDLQIAALPQIRAARPDAGLIIVGGGSQADAARAWVDGSPVRDHLLLAGDVPHPETLAAIARCDLLLRPTAFDGDSVSVREALALGTPVVATNNGMRPAGVHLIEERTSTAIADGAIAWAGARTAATERGGDTSNLDRVLMLYQRLLAT